MFSVKKSLGLMSICAAILFASEAQAQDGKATITAQDGSVLSCDVINGSITNCVPIAPAPAQVVVVPDVQYVNPNPAEVPIVDPVNQQFYQAPAPETVVVQTTDQAPELQPAPYEPVVVPEDHVVGRVLTDLGFHLLYNFAVTGIGIGLVFDATMNHESGVESGEFWSGIVIMGVGYSITPALSVMTSHAIWGGDGSMGWTWGGSFLGWLGAIGLGSIATTTGSENAAYYAIGIIAATLPIVGAILGYELTNKSNREQKYHYGSSVIIYPTFELSPERKTFGVGLQF